MFLIAKIVRGRRLLHELEKQEKEEHVAADAAAAQSNSQVWNSGILELLYFYNSEIFSSLFYGLVTTNFILFVPQVMNLFFLFLFCVLRWYFQGNRRGNESSPTGEEHGGDPSTFRPKRRYSSVKTLFDRLENNRSLVGFLRTYSSSLTNSQSRIMSASSLLNTNTKTNSKNRSCNSVFLSPPTNLFNLNLTRRHLFSSSLRHQPCNQNYNIMP